MSGLELRLPIHESPFAEQYLPAKHVKLDPPIQKFTRAGETWDYQELLAPRGIYYRLYQLQYKEQEVALPLAGGDAGGYSQRLPADD